MKWIVFYEGESERRMFNKLFYLCYQPVDITEDPLELLTTPDNQNCILLFPCEGYQNVFPNIEENHYLYQDDEIIIAARDLEQVPCFTDLRAELNTICSNLPHPDRIKLLFSKPQFEQVYFSDLNLL